MKVRNILLAALFAAPALAGTPATTTVDPLVTEPALSAKRLSGSLTLGYDSNYTGRGYVVSHSVAEGDSVVYGALKFNYDIGKYSKYWTLGHTLAYHVPTSGHRLYGNPDMSPIGAYHAGVDSGALSGAYVGVTDPEQQAMIGQGVIAKRGTSKIKQANIENQFTLITEAKYTREKWNVALGHSFIHGGLLGVMAKHYRDQGASCVNEVFIAPEWTPYQWLSVGVKTSYSFQGIQGWWFEPHVTVKFPIYGKPTTEGSVLGVVSLNMSATADYFADPYNACSNGTQAFWIKFSAPWFVKENIIVTPSVSFNWLGKGGIKANTGSEFRKYTDNPTMVPFRNFGVVAGISVTYTF